MHASAACRTASRLCCTLDIAEHKSSGASLCQLCRWLAGPTSFVSNFAKLHSCNVARGAYSKKLLKAWTDYDSAKGSENDDPAELPGHQLYQVQVCAHGGLDLEKVEGLTFAQARSMLCQVRQAWPAAEQVPLCVSPCLSLARTR